MRPYWDRPPDGGQRWTVIWVISTFVFVALVNGDWAKLNPGLYMGLIASLIIPSLLLAKFCTKRERQWWEEINDHVEYVARSMILEHEEEKHSRHETSEEE